MSVIKSVSIRIAASEQLLPLLLPARSSESKCILGVIGTNSMGFVGTAEVSFAVCSYRSEPLQVPIELLPDRAEAIALFEAVATAKTSLAAAEATGDADMVAEANRKLEDAIAKASPTAASEKAGADVQVSVATAIIPPEETAVAAVATEHPCCDHCGLPGAQARCAQCKSVFYCTHSCQVIHLILAGWP